MKSLLTLIAVVFILGACDPQETYQDCQQGQGPAFGGGGFNNAECGVLAFGHMFVHPSWY